MRIISAGAAILLPWLARAQTNQIIVEEDFESYGDTIAMREFWTSGTARLVTQAPGGGQAASDDGGEMNRHGGFSIGPDATHNLILSADLYDFATNADKRMTVSLRNPNGEGIEIGFQGTSCYVARVVGFGVNTNWVPFRKSQLAVEGWHRFRAVLSTSNVLATLDLNADGKIDRKLDLALASPPPELTQLRFGGLSGRPSRGGPVLVDNLKLELVSLSPVQTAPPAAPSVALVPPSAAASNAPTISLPLPSERDAGAGSALQVRTENNAMWWIFAALAVIIVLLAGLLFAFRQQGQSLKSLPEAAPARPMLPGTSSADVVTASNDWPQRPPAPGEKLGAELTEFAKQALVQGLYSQRNALIETQRRAQAALIDLEARLSELHLPVAEKIQAYEKRISELEKQLEERGDEMRELTRATLLLVRQKLEQERERSTQRFN